MSELDTSTQGLWWLKPQDHGPDNTSANMMNAARLQQQNRQLAMEEQRQQQETALFPLKKMDMENKLREQSYDLTDHFQKQQDDLQARDTANKIVSYFGRAKQGGIAGEPGTMAGMLNILKTSPNSWKHPLVQDIFKQAELATKATEAEKMFQDKADERAQEMGATLEERSGVARLGAEQRLQSSQISADARIKAADTRAATWGRHANYAAFKMELNAIGKKTDLDADQRAKLVEDAERKYDPTNLNPPGSANPAANPVDSSGVIKLKVYDPKTGTFH